MSDIDKIDFAVPGAGEYPEEGEDHQTFGTIRDSEFGRIVDYPVSHIPYAATVSDGENLLINHFVHIDAVTRILNELSTPLLNADLGRRSSAKISTDRGIAQKWQAKVFLDNYQLVNDLDPGCTHLNEIISPAIPFAIFRDLLELRFVSDVLPVLDPDAVGKSKYVKITIVREEITTEYDEVEYTPIQINKPNGDGFLTAIMPLAHQTQLTVWNGEETDSVTYENIKTGNAFFFAPSRHDCSVSIRPSLHKPITADATTFDDLYNKPKEQFYATDGVVLYMKITLTD